MRFTKGLKSKICLKSMKGSARLTRQRSGFSLIELIIAIAILVILVGLLAPQFMKYIEKSRRAACLSDMDTIARTYNVAMTEKTSDSVSEAIVILDEIMADYNAERKQTYDIYAIYTGTCKSGGEYQCTLENEFNTITVSCSKHGEWELDIVTLKTKLENMTIDKDEYPGAPYSSLNEYFNNSNRIELNSEANNNNTGGYGESKSMATIVSKELGKIGIYVANKSWRMYKKDDEYKLYLTNEKLTMDDNGREVECTLYDIQKEQIVHGTVKVKIKDGSYPVVDGGSFNPDEGSALSG